MDATPSRAERVGEPATARRYALGLLTVVYVANYMDRQILSILLPPIKQAFALSDGQLGFLSGISFAIFYATLGMPIALLADRGNRRNVIAVATAVFSVMTVLCGAAQSFLQLLLARIGVGVGEAGTSPPSHSILSDLYAPAERATALGVFSGGLNLGILLGFLTGGWVNELFGWRAAFGVVGVPGLVLAVLVRATLREPERGRSEGRSAHAEPAPKLLLVLATLWRLPSARHIAFACALAAFVGYGAVFFVPSFLSRSFGMTSGEIGTALAILFGGVGWLGTFGGGWVADRLARRDVRWNVWMVAIAVAGAMPLGIAAYLAPDAALSLLALVVPALVGAVYLAPSVAMIQGLVPLRMRTTASAVLLFIINIVGLGLGPQAVGLLSDALAPRFGSESLRYALLGTGLVNGWAAFHYWRAGATLRADLAAAR